MAVYRYNRTVSEKPISLNRCLIDEKGCRLSINKAIYQYIGIQPDKIEYKYESENHYVDFTFNIALSTENETKLNALFIFMLNKSTFTAIENKQIAWRSNKYAVHSMLPTIEAEMKILYNSATWVGLSFFEQRIIASWHVCTEMEALEVMTQGEWDACRFYEFYKHINERTAKSLNQDDIYKAPYYLDFTICFKEQIATILAPKVTGRPTHKDYYAKYNLQTYDYTNHFARMTFDFSDATDKMIVNKSVYLQYVYNNGDIDTINTQIVESKSRIYHPMYDADERLAEAKDRRLAVIYTLQIEIVVMIMQTQGLSQADAELQGISFQKLHTPAINEWIEYGEPVGLAALIPVINGDVVHAWLNADIGGGVTIREYMINKFSLLI